MENKTVKFIVNAAVIGALYAVMTLLLAPVSYGVIQVRVSEVLCMLSLFTPAAVPGLTAGCFIANILGTNGIIDAVLGAFATLIGTFCMYKLRKHIYLAPLCNVIANGVIIGHMLWKFYLAEFALPLCMLSVAAGELVPLYVLGIPLSKAIQKNPALINGQKGNW